MYARRYLSKQRGLIEPDFLEGPKRTAVSTL